MTLATSISTFLVASLCALDCGSKLSSKRNNSRFSAALGHIADICLDLRKTKGIKVSSLDAPNPHRRTGLLN